MGRRDCLRFGRHELAHLFGFGTALSWNSLVNVRAGTFTSAVARAANGTADAGDMLDASVETINEAFATFFPFE